MNLKDSIDNNIGFNPYRVLGLTRQADAHEIKQAYFKLVRQFPPETAPDKFKEIRKAYDQLKDPERRARTNLFLVQAPDEFSPTYKPEFDQRVALEDLITLVIGCGMTAFDPASDFSEPKIIQAKGRP